jgi:hypothetical protein
LSFVEACTRIERGSPAARDRGGEVRVCPNCRRQNPDDADFCECGEYLRWDETDPGRAAREVERWPDAVSEPVTSPAEPDAPTLALAQGAVEPDGGDSVSADDVLLALSGPGGGPGPVLLTVDAGGQVAGEALVRNQTEVVGRYRLEVTGVPRGWVSVSPDALSLLPYGTADSGYEQPISLLFHPPRSPEAEARDWPFELVAAAESDGRRLAAAPGTLRVAPYQEFDAKLRPTRAEGGRSGRFRLVVSNGGNGPLMVELDGDDPDGAVSFAFAPARLSVGLRGEAAAEVTVTAARPSSGPPVDRQLSVYATAGRIRVGTAGVFRQQARFTRGRTLALRLVLTLLAAAALVGGSFLSWGSAGGERLEGICRGESSGECMSYSTYVALVADGTDVSFDPPGSGFDGLFDFGTSLGMLTLVLGVVSLLGLRTGRATWVAGALAALVLVAFLLTAQTSGAGVAMAFAGAVLALVAGFLPSGR